MLRTCAKLCLDAYDPKAPGFIEIGDLRYGVFDTEHGRIIAIRGTDPEKLKNWMRDADILPTRSCAGYLGHSGFIGAFKALCVGGMPTSKGAADYVTGHSLGGAIALQLAAHIGAKAVTFGCPKVYWRLGKAPIVEHTRVARDDDPVPMMPGMMYSHREEPMLLKDNDHHLIQVKDHSMAGYLAALDLAA